MTLASVLALVDGGPNGAKAAKTALAVGRSFGCYVEFLHVQVPIEALVPVMGEGMSGSVAEQIIATARNKSAERAEAAGRVFDEHCVKAGLTVVGGAGEAKPGRFAVAFRRLTGYENPVVAKSGRLFDLIVVARPDENEGGIDAAGLEAALFETGRPVLFAAESPRDSVGQSIVVAWDGSREAARGAGAALPFLRRATEAAVISVGEAGKAADPEALARHLGLHGVKVSAFTVKPHHRKIGAALLEETARRGAHLLVMGAYGHSALREIVFGGTTREVLKSAAIPVLMAH